jgi:hypothetical protein
MELHIRLERRPRRLRYLLRSISDTRPQQNHRRGYRRASPRRHRHDGRDSVSDQP